MSKIGKEMLPKELRSIENRLQTVLHPVTPSAAFVADLRGMLDEEMVRKQKSKKVRIGLLIAGGILGAAALLITIIRSLTSWEKLSAAVARSMPKFRKREGAASI